MKILSLSRYLENRTFRKSSNTDYITAFGFYTVTKFDHDIDVLKIMP